MASLVAALSLVGVTVLLAPSDLPAVLLIAAGIAFTHTANIRRLLQGEEKQVVRPVRWARDTQLTAIQALAQGPAGQAPDSALWPSRGQQSDESAAPDCQDEAKLE